MLNLSNIKRIAFIPNFDPKKSYPEFGSKIETKATKPTIAVAYPETVVVEKKDAPVWKKKLAKRIKWEKRKFKKTVGVGYKPTILTTNRLD